MVQVERRGMFVIVELMLVWLVVVLVVEIVGILYSKGMQI
jgi:hypothetical protein